MNGHVEIITLLVDAGAQLEAKDNREVSAWVVWWNVLCLYRPLLKSLCRNMLVNHSIVCP